MVDNEFEYDVALSFAGEDRIIAKGLFNLLINKNIKVFYDEDEADDLWGKDLIAHLANLYQNKARFCVMFISKHYPLKRWTNFERQHIQARAFRDTNEYILPIRIDDTEVPGIAETTGYRDIRQHSLESIANILGKKLAKAKGQDALSQSQVAQPDRQESVHSSFGTIPMPKRKKAFTQLDKDRFARESFNYIKQYFQQALQQLESNYSDIQTEFTEISPVEFIGKIYVQGNLFRQCQIWLGGDRSSDTIYYNEGLTMSSGRNSFNDYLPVESNGEELRLHIGHMAIGVKVEEPLATKENAALYLWQRITAYLESR
jgi:hypothetical protein